MGLVYWLLTDLCERYGFSKALRHADRFAALVADGPDRFANEVLIVEGLDPQLEKTMRQMVREVVGQRFEQWRERTHGPAN